MLGNAYAQCTVGISLRQSRGRREGGKTEKRRRYASRGNDPDCPECKG